MENTKKVICYCRVSSTEQASHGFSLQNQKDRALAFCTYKQYPEPIFISDEGISAKKMSNRPGLQQIIKMVANKEVERIIIFSLSRLSRNTLEALLFLKDLEKQKVALHSLTDDLNTDTAIGRFYLLMKLGLAELESAQISERVSSVLQNKKSKGEVYVKAITGFENREGNLIAIPEELEKVKTIFTLAKDNSPYHIAKRLNQQKISTKHGNNFTPLAIKKILKNRELYQEHLN